MLPARGISLFHIGFVGVTLQSGESCNLVLEGVSLCVILGCGGQKRSSLPFSNAHAGIVTSNHRCLHPAAGSMDPAV